MSFFRGAFQDFTGAELRNWRFQNASSAPSSPVIGQPYYDTSKGGVFIWNGSAQRPVDAALLSDGSIKIAGLEVDPRARSTHTGTQLSSTISDLASTVKGYTLDSFAAPINSVSFNNQRQTLVAAGVSGTDGVNYSQVQNLIQSAVQGVNAIKSPVRLAANSNLSLSGLQSLQGITLVDGDRVLLTAQTTASQNLIYVAHSGAWTIAVDDDGSSELVPGTQVLITEGNYAGTVFRITTLGTITPGTTAITWTQAAQPGSYSADEATLHLASGVFSARLAYGLTTVSGGIQVLPAPNYGLQVLSTGVAVLLAPSSGLAVDSTGLHIDRTSALKTSQITSLNITGDGSKTVFALTHNLNTRDIVPAFQDSSYAKFDVDWVATDVNTLTVTFGTPPSNGTTFRVTITS
jgi:hypothetical protein